MICLKSYYKGLSYWKKTYKKEMLVLQSAPPNRTDPDHCTVPDKIRYSLFS